MVLPVGFYYHPCVQCAPKPVIYWEWYYISRVQRVCGLQQDILGKTVKCFKTVALTYSVGYKPLAQHTNKPITLVFFLQGIAIINHTEHWWIHVHCADKSPVTQRKYAFARPGNWLSPFRYETLIKDVIQPGLRLYISNIARNKVVNKKLSRFTLPG